MIKDLEGMTAATAKASAWQSIWTFPSMILSALVIAWGAESAQFLVSQAFALTMLAFIQTLPEFAVEGVIAWHAGKAPSAANIGLMTANFTGALRLLVGLGWPLIYTTTLIFNFRKSHNLQVVSIELEDEHSIELTGLFIGSLYALVIVLKGTLNLFDSAILIMMYITYVFILLKLPSRDDAEIEDLEFVPRYILTRKKIYRNLLIWCCFIGGGGGIIFIAAPFIESALGLSFVLGVPAFMMIQWLAPFLSEFPEKISAFYWAKSVVKAPMALMNMVSSGIAETTLLISIIPIVFCFSLGNIQTIEFDWAHRAEILLTAMQGILGVIILSKMKFRWFEATGLFVLWFTQIYFQYGSSQVIIPFVNDASAHAILWEIFHIEILESYIFIYLIWIIVELTAILGVYKTIPMFKSLKIAWATKK